MSSVDDSSGPGGRASGSGTSTNSESVERQLFESLIHHLIEKGVLTRNDALGIVQTVAEVKRGEAEEGKSDPASIAGDLNALHRLYSSFELVTDRQGAALLDGNVRHLRPPLHGNNPKFPMDD